MKYTMFATPTEFDMRSLTVQGMSAKPNSDNPIGRFGSGLKYAIAILLREGAKITLHCNGTHYEFYTTGTKFRGEIFDQCAYRRTQGITKIWDNHDLPYTTELGKHWELWQAFRELYANTSDEDGWCQNFTGEELANYDYAKNHTYILVEHLEFGLLVPKKAEIFLDPQREVIVDTLQANVTAQKSTHLYFRGMRAYDLPENQQAMFQYNIIDNLELTEDRTIKEIYWAKDKIQDLVTHSHNKDFIKAVLTAPDESFEAKNLNFQHSFNASETFKEVVTELRDDKRLAPSARTYYGTYISPPRKKVIEDAQWIMILQALSDASSALSERDDTNEDTVTLFGDIYLKAFQKKFDR